MMIKNLHANQARLHELKRGRVSTGSIIIMTYKTNTETDVQPLIHIKPSARKKLLNILKKDENSGKGFRIFLNGYG